MHRHVKALLVSNKLSCAPQCNLPYGLYRPARLQCELFAPSHTCLQHSSTCPNNTACNVDICIAFGEFRRGNHIVISCLTSSLVIASYVSFLIVFSP